MPPDAATIIAGLKTVSDQIRALDAAGYSRAEIARLLNKRYQHVRNVLEDDRTRDAPRGVAEGPRDWIADLAGDAPWRLPVDETGSLRLPPEALKALGLRPGGVAIAELQPDRLVVLSGAAAARKARDLVAALNLAPERRLSDELIADRRREAEDEAKRG